MIAAVFCLFLLIGPSLMDPSCPDNEIYQFCGTYCPPTCQIPVIHNCFEVCVSGCFCQEGYIRQSLNGTCILFEECQKNEIFDDCGSRCPPTCLNPTPACEKSCSQGCFCEEGFILEDKTQICIQKDACQN